MSVYRTIRCDICDAEQTETVPGGGWEGWGQLMGVTLDGIDNPNLCPEHLRALADTANRMKDDHDGLD